MIIFCPGGCDGPTHFPRLVFGVGKFEEELFPTETGVCWLRPVGQAQAGQAIGDVGQVV